MRQLILYTAAFIIILFYGDEVCPFLESLTALELSVPVAGGLFIQFFISRLIFKKFIELKELHNQSFLTFFTEFILFVFFGFFMALFNLVYYKFPILSGLKLTLAMSSLGLFIGLDLSLKVERDIGFYVLKSGDNIEIKGNFFSITTKFAVLSTFISVFVIFIFFLVVNKDLDWMVNSEKIISPYEARRAILIDVSFVVAVFLGFILNTILSYSKNMQFFFKNEAKALRAAAGGNLSVFVPVSTNDDFGLMALYTNTMISNLYKKNLELHKTQDITIRALVSIGASRDNETGAHILRTQEYVRILGKMLKENKDCSSFLTDDLIEIFFKSAPLHDIGKVGIPDSILLKPDKLDNKEWQVMKTHAYIGAKALMEAEKELGHDSFLKHASDIAYFHHEKYDGTGYPRGLAGDEIPFSARLMAVADVYDALTSKRVYKPAFSHEKAKDIILEGAGSHFDPCIVEAFVECEDKFIATSLKYKE